MSFRLYRIFFFTALGVGFASLLSLLAYSLVLSEMPRTLSRALLTSAMLFWGFASLLSVACGLQHRKMWVKGGLRSYKNEEKASLAIDLTVFATFGAVLWVLAFKTWIFNN